MPTKLKLSIVRKLNNERGAVLLIAYFAVLVLLGIGAAFLVLITTESRTAERQRLTTIAFHIAEAGVERGLYDLRQDFVTDTSNPSWSDGDINTYAIGPDINSFYTIPYSSTALNGGSYTVQFKNVSGATDDIWVRSTGTISGVTQTIDVYVKMVSLSPWEYAIFAGAGASGAMVNGNVNIRGSVLILGSGLSAGDYAIDLGGTAEIVGNNYNGLSSALKAKVPALPTTIYNGETVETLSAELRVKKGLVGVSGSSSVGEVNVGGNAVKELVDGVYVNDGFGGNQGTSGVYSENGYTHAYDLGDSVVFPSLNDAFPGYASYKAYLKANAYVPTVAEAAELANIKPTSNFNYGNAKGRITVDGSGNMTVSGIVYLDNSANLGFNKAGSNKTINYTGAGTVYVDGVVNVNTDILTAGNASFPSNAMGIMTPNTITFNEASISVMGAFYAENSIIAQKQTNIMGTFVSNYFDMGTNVPAIYQVPDLSSHLPPGMIGASSKWYMVVAWIKSY